VQIFALDLMENILRLHRDLADGTYRHGAYQAFKINDPKPRQIHKSSVRDRLLHHAIYRILYPFFDRTFVADSFSCRVNKGTHKAIRRFCRFNYRASKNHTRTVWVLKCDIRKFFENIDHEILLKVLGGRILDENIIGLLMEVISSFSSGLGRGLPLGNLTSQLFVNVYMNEFDYFVKEGLKAEHYIRYADDFVIMSGDKNWLESLIPKISGFLWENLRLQLHSDKVFIKTLASGVDWLGWINFPMHRVLRTATKQRMFKKINNDLKIGTISSYLGMLKHGNTHKLKKVILQIVKDQ